MGKKKLLVSFSGGETSAYMAQWLWNNKQAEYEMVFVFANTGVENEETLRFIRMCQEYFKFPITCIEASVNHGERKGTGHKIVDFNTASREGEPFEQVIIKYGIPNKKFPHCTRELKLQPIKHYMKSIGWNNYYTAIGIRVDEIDRMSLQREKNNLIYPLIQMRPMSKPKINFWWSQQPFRLNLKGYQGNCVTCWKKSDSKLYQIAKEDEKAFNFMSKMELRYGKHVPPSRTMSTEDLPVTFFRSNRSAIDIVSESKNKTVSIKDDADVYDNTESCELFTECGTDN